MPNLSTDRNMGFSAFLTWTAVWVAILHQLHQVTAFPLHAAALNDIPTYSDSTDREWRMQVDAHVKEHLATILRDEAVNRLDKLGKVSDSPEFLQRTFMSPAALRAGQLIRTWMSDAGLFTWIDDMGNVHGRFDGMNSSAPALLIGSHMDTVIDAGRYDGALGVVSAIAAVKALQKSGRLVDYPRPIEIIAFSDEEGVRFQSTFLGSGAIAGTLSPNLLQVKDKRGVTVSAALQKLSFPGTKESLFNLKYEPESVWGYVEVHIEQGPVLESKGLPLGVVDAIAGQTRLRVSMKGSAGHAGTVPMAMRKDPMPAAAQAIVAIEELCIRPQQGGSPATVSRPTANKGGALVCTVGEIASWPGASNVIPGEVTFSVDVRAKDDNVRELAVLNMELSIHEICRNRAIACTIERKNEAKTVECDKELIDRLSVSATAATNELFSLTGVQTTNEEPVPTLSSGAGHDALAMAQLTKVGIMFVRCTGGISHSPEEHVLDDDIWAAGLALHSFLESDLPASFSA
ncbi:allantoate deiminase [Marchantia polymorpha subsp. ruderalis]|nr:hypothetical protein MARPO_0026s0071 [Marchantia polymorpha]BBN02124.1 hypothetical protein Mp_2g13010 [Marchantia polymorpha subsp. ruderalis]|eukprot:PTQ43196.1 hypothetical protein MARPO_0026s0071 [Marchantia polymorpha]